MRVQSFYKAAVWLPLLVPAMVAILVHTLGMHPSDGDPLAKVVQIVLISGIYGGIPYALLAAWATWWIDQRPEPEIRRRALRAPLWMLLLWIPFAAFGGIASRQIETFLALLGLGVAFALGLGYIYVALVFLLRRAIDPTGWLIPSVGQRTSEPSLSGG